MSLKGKHLVLSFFFLLFFVKIEMVGQVINNSGKFEEGNVERNSTFNIEEIKVRWKKAALDNCTGVPCVVTPPAPSFTCGTSTVTDFDGNVYETVAIVGTGVTQCWTKTNLKVTKYNDGTLIGDSTNSTWGTAMIGAHTGYNINVVTLSNYVGTFGYLYNWYAVNDSRKLCPDGWHVPTNSDWNKLVKSIDSGADTSISVLQNTTTAGTILKSSVTNISTDSGLGWNPASPASPGTNTSGFSALPGGFGSPGNFNQIRNLAFIWSATGIDVSTAWLRVLSRSVGGVERAQQPKSTGASVRCLKD